MASKLLLVCLLLCACAGNRMIETSLYFGQSKPNGGSVSEKEWQEFKETQLARVFREGSTVIPASGNWFDPEARRLITEPTYVVVYFYKKSETVSKQIDSLRNFYKSRFQQQSVLRVDKKATAYF